MERRRPASATPRTGAVTAIAICYRSRYRSRYTIPPVSQPPRHRAAAHGAPVLPPQHRVTIKEIAAITGVSTQTVSRVINKRPDVSPATRQLVEAAIEECTNNNKPLPDAIRYLAG